MYNKVDTNMNFVDREKALEKFWRENDIFRKTDKAASSDRACHTQYRYAWLNDPYTCSGILRIGCGRNCNFQENPGTYIEKTLRIN